MTRPAATISQCDTIEHCARAMADEYLHRLVVVDDDGLARGMVSALDVVCALIGRPVRHPAPFPHYDRKSDVFWSDDMLLEAASPESVLDGPGVLALISGGKGRPETLAWAEAVPNLPVRLAELTSPFQFNPKYPTVESVDEGVYRLVGNALKKNAKPLLKLTKIFF
jgi:hypothetical protein